MDPAYRLLPVPRACLKDCRYAVQTERRGRILNHHSGDEVKSVQVAYDCLQPVDLHTVCALSEKKRRHLVELVKNLENLLIGHDHDQILSFRVFGQNTLYVDFYLALGLS